MMASESRDKGFRPFSNRFIECVLTAEGASHGVVGLLPCLGKESPLLWGLARTQARSCGVGIIAFGFGPLYCLGVRVPGLECWQRREQRVCVCPQD